MRIQLVILILLGAATISVSQQSTDKQGVPPAYAGNWVCQTFTPGYNIIPPYGNPTRPMTTPGSVAIVKFTLRKDGSYETPSAKGKYSYDAATKSITWLDGPHQKTVTKTELGKRDNGAPKIGFVMNKRYYGCFIPKEQRK